MLTAEEVAVQKDHFRRGSNTRPRVFPQDPGMSTAVLRLPTHVRQAWLNRIAALIPLWR